MSLIGKNIKKIRSLKKMNQQEFADIFDLKRASIGAYEEGRADPKIKVVIEIAKNFGISLDDFLQKELTVNDLAHFDLFKDGLTPKVKHNLKPSLKINYSREITLYSPSNLLDLNEVDQESSSQKITLPTTFIPNAVNAFQVYQKENDVFEVGYEDILLSAPIGEHNAGVGILIINKGYTVCHWRKHKANYNVYLNDNWELLSEKDTLFNIVGKMTQKLDTDTGSWSEVVQKLKVIEEEIKKGR